MKTVFKTVSKRRTDLLEERKGILDEDENAYKVLAMLFESIVYRMFMEEKAKNEEMKKKADLPTISIIDTEGGKPWIQA